MNSDIEIQKNELREQLDKLRYEYKIELPKKIAEARALGDLKENAEYHAARERQSFVQSRIAQLSRQLSSLNNIDISNLPEDRIAYGSQVSLIDVNTKEMLELTFVSTNEVNPSEGKVSLSSPYGAALQNKTTGETVEVKIPVGVRTLYIERLVTIHGNELEKKMNLQ